MKFDFKVGNDNGFSEHDINIDGLLVQQPNTNVAVDQIPWSDEQQIDQFIPNILDQLVVTVDSKHAKPGMYYVGKFAVTSGKPLNYMQFETEKKFEVDLPIVNTLANIAAVAVQRSYNESKDKKLVDNLEVKVDMTTALPLSQYNDDSAKLFTDKFMDAPHNVTVHVGKERVFVKIVFDFVKVVPEATPVIFALQKDSKGDVRKDDIYTPLVEEYELKNINGSHFKEKRIMHLDIGDGTTEYAVTSGIRPDRQFKKGSNHGAGHAIEEAIDDLAEKVKLLSVERHWYEEVVKRGDVPGNKYYGRAMDSLQKPLESQVREITKRLSRELDKARNEVDYIVVYGGGSILMRNILYPILKKTADEREIKLFYIPSKYAVTLNSDGLYAFVNGKIFEALKAKTQNESTVV